MISTVEGKISFKGERFVVIDTGGVGYRVFVSPETMRKFPAGESGVKLWTHLQVREDALELYGFLEYAEVEFFETLISISGIGPKSALGILGVAPLDTLKRAIASGETAYLTKVSGIGKRTAERVVVELKDKLAGSSSTEALGKEIREETDILEALTTMGYSVREVVEALKHVSAETTGTEKRLSAALKVLGKGKR